MSLESPAEHYAAAHRRDDEPQRPDAAADLPLTRIVPSGGFQPVNLMELWRYRELLYFLAWRDVKVRYKQTALGAAWAVLQPLLMMVVFTIFFGRLAGISSGKVPYPLFAYAGLLPWTFFSTAVTSAGNSVVGAERLITKIYFPRLAIPLAAVGAAIVDFLVAMGLLGVMMAYYRIAPGMGMLLLPLIFGLIVVTAIGVGTFLGALNVTYRDFRYVIPFLVQLWMFATPSVYMQVNDAPAMATSAAPTTSTAAVASDAPRAVKAPPGGAPRGVLKAVLALNPMTGLITAFRAAALGGTVPWSQLGVSAVSAAVALVAGCLYFRRVEDSFADII
jgi:lipopolysaccharide transport system permease protein